MGNEMCKECEQIKKCSGWCSVGEVDLNNREAVSICLSVLCPMCAEVIKKEIQEKLKLKADFKREEQKTKQKMEIIQAETAKELAIKKADKDNYKYQNDLEIVKKRQEHQRQVEITNMKWRAQQDAQKHEKEVLVLKTKMLEMINKKTRNHFGDFQSFMN